MNNATIPKAGTRTWDEMEQEIQSIEENEIDYSDIPETTPEQWSKAVRGKFYRPVKDQVTLRIDRDVLAWFRYNHEKYQTAINQALREHMNRERKTS